MCLSFFPFSYSHLHPWLWEYLLSVFILIEDFLFIVLSVRTPRGARVLWGSQVGFNGTSWALLNDGDLTLTPVVLQGLASGPSKSRSKQSLQEVGPGQSLQYLFPLASWNIGIRNRNGAGWWSVGKWETPSPVLFQDFSQASLWKAIVNLSCVSLQGKSLSNVNSMVVIGSLPIAVIERNIPMCIPVTSPTTARSEAVTNPTLTRVL